MLIPQYNVKMTKNKEIEKGILFSKFNKEILNHKLQPNHFLRT